MNVTDGPPLLGGSALSLYMGASPAQEVAAGVFAGVCDAFAIHPVDQLKTQFHVNTRANPSVLASLRKQVRAGGVTRLYRGVLAASLRPQALCMYTGNEWCKRIVVGPSGELTVPKAFLAGGLTGYVEAVSVTPFEVVKVRMQSLDHVGRYTSSMHCLRTMLAEEGVLSLYNGFWASCWRNCTINGMLFGLIFWTKHSEHVALPTPRTSAGAVAQDIAVAMWAGFVGTFVKMPFDVAKSRLQNQPTPPAGTRPKYVHTLQCLETIVREEGAGACFKGLMPTLARMSLGQGVAYAAFEFALERMRRHETSRTSRG